jgi:rubrerythrin
MIELVIYFLAFGLGIWFGWIGGYKKGRSSMWDYCRELKKNLEEETKAKNELRKLIGLWELGQSPQVDYEHDGGITKDHDFRFIVCCPECKTALGEDAHDVPCPKCGPTKKRYEKTP